MNPLARQIQRTYLALIFGNTLAASFIWGINTLFLLDAGLSNFEAFAANAFFTLGMVAFEIPTGVIADTVGRRMSYLLGTVTLSVSTFLYYLLWQIHAPFWEWAVVSVLLGLGFTFFSGAVEAWLVDALKFAKYKGNLENVFGRGQIAGGIAMLSGSVLGGVIAQLTSLGVPFIVRSVVLVVLFVGAYVFMKDLGFTPVKQTTVRAVKGIWNASLEHGLKNPPVRYIMLAAPFTASVGFYAFYALQPYLLELWGDTSAYTVAGLAAALLAASQVAGGFAAPKIRNIFKRRTSALAATIIGTVLVLVAIGLVQNFWLAIILVAVWGLLFAAAQPIHSAYLNGMIPSKQRATVLSFNSLMGNVGGVFVQPALGRAADVYSYGTSFIAGAVIQLISLPFVLKSRVQRHPADTAHTEA
jgi:MFS family permease